jgi:hypothetical protein
MSINGQNSLLNSFVPTFYIKNVVGGQILTFDATRGAFVNTFNAGTSGATALTQLTDVQINPTTLLTGQVLSWQGVDDWTNAFVDYNTLLNKPTLAAVATVGTLASLTDVITTGAITGSSLEFNSTTNKWSPVNGHSGSIQAVQGVVNLSSNATINIGNLIPINATILQVKIVVTVAANNGTTLTIGVSGNVSKYANSSSNNPTITGIYTIEEYDVLSQATQIIATVAGASGAGRANVVIQYQLP